MLIFNSYHIMKKLSLNELNLNPGDLLGKEQLKSVFGGGLPLTHYPGDGPCANYVERVPTGCPCSTLPCASGYYESGQGTVYSSGSCEDGYCVL